MDSIRKSTIASLVLLVLGLVCHGLGFSALTDSQQGTLSHNVGLVLDGLAGAVVLFRAKRDEQSDKTGRGGKTLPLLTLALLLPVLPGCAHVDPLLDRNAPREQRIASAEEWFTTLTDSLTLLRKQGYIDDKTQVEVNKALHEVSDLLDKVKADPTLDINAVLRIVRERLNQLAMVESEAKSDRSRSRGPSTAPVEPSGQRGGKATSGRITVARGAAGGHRRPALVFAA